MPHKKITSGLATNRPESIAGPIPISLSMRRFSMSPMNQTNSFSYAGVWLCFALAAAFGVSTNAQTPEGILEVQCDGMMGTTRAGMTIEIKQAPISGGHYFVAENLRDIPI